MSLFFFFQKNKMQSCYHDFRKGIKTFELGHIISHKTAFVPGKDSDQSVHQSLLSS